MAKTPKNHGKAWTPAHDKQFRKLNRENTPTRVMGLKLRISDTGGLARARAGLES